MIYRNVKRIFFLALVVSALAFWFTGCNSTQADVSDGLMAPAEKPLQFRQAGDADEFDQWFDKNVGEEFVPLQTDIEMWYCIRDLHKALLEFERVLEEKEKQSKIKKDEEPTVDQSLWQKKAEEWAAGQYTGLCKPCDQRVFTQAVDKCILCQGSKNTAFKRCVVCSHFLNKCAFCDTEIHEEDTSSSGFQKGSCMPGK